MNRKHRSAFLASWILSLALLSHSPARADEPDLTRPADNLVRRLAIDPNHVLLTTRPATGPLTGPATRPSTGPASQAAPPKTDTLKDCESLYMKGEYAAAAGGYEKLTSQKALRVGAGIGLAQVYQMEGKYDKAIETLKSVAADAATDAEWHLAMADLLTTVGKYQEALKHAVTADELKPSWAPAIFARGAVLEIIGRKDEAIAVYKTMDKVVAGDAWRKDARTLVALGQILDRYAILTGKKASEQAENVLQNYFQEAYQKVDRSYWPANIAAGNLLLAKHRPETAVKEFQAAQKINPKLPDAAVGMGVVVLGMWQFEQAMGAADSALKINPNHDQALILKAVVYLQWRKLEEVEPCLQKVLKVNPNHLEALSLMAALHVRRGEPEKAKPYIEAAQKVNPKYAGLPNAIGEWLAAARQFTEAEKYYRQAMELAPEQAEAITNLGLMYMQTGDEAKAKEILEKAQKLDDFRADVVNYLNLLERLAKFQVKETENFIIKVDSPDAVLLEPVAQFMESIYPEVCGDYEYKPPVKTMIEIFPTHGMFSIRISGRGWIGTIGACTGRVIALAAPSKERSDFGTHNWATVLRHEFAHSVTLSATENRIPHWFTEACAVWQQPDRRSYEAIGQLVNASRREQLFSIKELDWGFIRPKRAGDRSLAYAQAEWVMEFIITEHGFPTIAKMLRGFRDRMTQKDVFKKILSTTEEEFDKKFKTWTKGQVKEWGFDPEPVPDLAKAAQEAKDKPKDPNAHATHSVGLYLAGQRDNAEKAARKALELDADCTRAMAVLATVLADKKKYDEAIETASKLEKLDPTSRRAPRVLADCYLAKRSWAQAIAALELLKQRQQYDPYSYQELAKMYMQFGQPEKALPNLIELHRRTMRDPQYARQIAEIYRTMGDDEKALAYFKEISFIDPYEASAYESIASIHLRAKRYDDAITAVNNVCLCQPDSANSWALMAVVRYRTGKALNDKDQLMQARAAAEKALRIDPSNDKANQVMAAIDALPKDG
jgi:tetratricopeptide (TPR) repeat protein